MNRFAWEALVAGLLGCAVTACIVGCDDSSMFHDFDTTPAQPHELR